MTEKIWGIRTGLGRQLYLTVCVIEAANEPKHRQSCYEECSPSSKFGAKRCGSSSISQSAIEKIYTTGK